MSAIFETATGARYLASCGHRIFPLPPGTKAANLPNWQNIATSDAAQVAQWWPEGSQNNIGIVGGDGRLILDIDWRKGGCREALAALEVKYGALPPTYTVRTPSGGEHRYYSGADVPNTAGKLGAGLDIKSRGGYVVGPWSFTTEIPGKQSTGYYMVTDDRAPVPAPQWLIELAGTPKATTDVANIRLREATPAQWTDIRSALDHLASVPEVASNKLWSDIGYALLCLGDEGRELWCEWSTHAPGYGGVITPETWWASHAADRARSDFRMLFTIAQRYGWRNPNPAGDPNAIQWSTTLPPGASATPVTPPVPTAMAPPPIELTRASDIRPEPIRWLWIGWLPSGKLVILAGVPGTGKSTIAFTLAAIVSRGSAWPDKAPPCKAANVLIWSGEDDPADTIVPRLMAAGADLKRVHIIRGKLGPNNTRLPFDPATDIAQLEQTIGTLDGATALLIVDPIVSAVSGDMHKASEVRRSLQALVDLGAKFDCAVIGITHFKKDSKGGMPQERVLGSQAFGALARLVLVCAESEEDGRRVFARAKSNISKDRGGIEYGIGTTPVAGNIEAARIEWGATIEGTAREILGDVEDTESEHEGGKVAECMDAMRALLTGADGQPIEVAGVAENLMAAGFTERRIRKAKRKLRVTHRSEGFPRRTLWRLPMPTTAATVQPTESFIKPPTR